MKQKQRLTIQEVIEKFQNLIGKNPEIANYKLCIGLYDDCDDDDEEDEEDEEDEGVNMYCTYEFDEFDVNDNQKVVTISGSDCIP